MPFFHYQAMATSHHYIPNPVPLLQRGTFVMTLVAPDLCLNLFQQHNCTHTGLLIQGFLAHGILKARVTQGKPLYFCPNPVSSLVTPEKSCTIVNVLGLSFPFSFRGTEMGMLPKDTSAFSIRKLTFS